jgi:hypothetical protein
LQFLALLLLRFCFSLAFALPLLCFALLRLPLASPTDPCNDAEKLAESI